MAVYDSVNFNVGNPGTGSGDATRALGVGLFRDAMKNLQGAANNHEKNIREMNTETLLNMMKEGKEVTDADMKEVGRHNPEALEKARMNIVKFDQQSENDDRRFGLDTLKTGGYLSNLESQEAYRSAQIQAAKDKLEFEKSKPAPMGEFQKLVLKDQLDMNQLIKKKELGLLPGQKGKGSSDNQSILKKLGMFTNYDDETEGTADAGNMADANRALDVAKAKGVKTKDIKAAAALAVGEGGFLSGYLPSDEIVFNKDAFIDYLKSKGYFKK